LGSEVLLGVEAGPLRVVVLLFKAQQPWSSLKLQKAGLRDGHLTSGGLLCCFAMRRPCVPHPRCPASPAGHCDPNRVNKFPWPTPVSAGGRGLSNRYAKRGGSMGPHEGV
jgi:hypothetical protein